MEKRGVTVVSQSAATSHVVRAHPQSGFGVNRRGGLAHDRRQSMIDPQSSTVVPGYRRLGTGITVSIYTDSNTVSIIAFILLTYIIN